MAEGSINGKQYNRAERIHKQVYEALMRLAWDENINWLESNDPKLTSRQRQSQLLEQVVPMSSNLKQEVS